VADAPVGLSEKEVIRTITALRAFGEIMNVAPPQLDTILAKAKASLELKPAPPVRPPRSTP